MTISDNIIIGKSVSHKAKSILKSIKKGRRSSHIFWYAVTTAPEKENLMYILSSVEMGQPFYHDIGLTLIALAGSRKEALEQVSYLVKQGYNTGNIGNMKEYLESVIS